MTATTVVICEASGDWAALVRRNLPGATTVVEIRTIDELWTPMREAPQAVVAMELRGERGWELLTSLRRLDRDFPEALPVVLAQRHLRSWEDLCREAGAVAFIASPRSIGDLLQIAGGRGRSESEWTVDDQQLPLEDRILANLPWAN